MNNADGGQTPRRGPGRPSIPPDDVRCTARSRQRQDRCRNYREAGFTVCRDHGGLTPTGLDNPSTTHGRYSRVMPKKLSERFEALVTDPDILNLNRDLGLLDVRMEELIARIETAESEVGWRTAKDAYTKLRTALREGNAAAVNDALGQLDRLFARATANEATWRDIREIAQERRLVVESERRRLVDLHQMVTVEEMMLFANALVALVNQHVADPAVKTAIALGVRGLLGGRRPYTASRPGLAQTAIAVTARVATSDRQNGVTDTSGETDDGG